MRQSLQHVMFACVVAIAVGCGSDADSTDPRAPDAGPDGAALDGGLDAASDERGDPGDDRDAAGEDAQDAAVPAPAMDAGQDGCAADRTPPRIEVEAPRRGAMLETTDDVTLRARVVDAASALDRVTINGDGQLDADAGREVAIDTALSGRFGLNVVELEATDACGNRAHHVQSYLRSARYRPAATAPDEAARVATGHVLRLTQEAVDDGDREDVDDAATLIEGYLRRNLPAILRAQTSDLVIDQREPCPLVGHDIRVQQPGVSFVPHVDSIELSAGGTRQVLSGTQLTVPIRVAAVRPSGVVNCQPGQQVPETVTLSAASVAIDSRTDVAIDDDAELEVTLRSIDATLQGVQVTATGREIIDDLVSGLVGLFTDRIEAAIEAVLREQIPPLIEDALDGFRPEATLHSGLFGLELGVASGLEAIEATAAAMRHDAHAQLYPSEARTPHDSGARGPLARATAPPALDASPGPVTYAVDDNLINQGLWSLWFGGGLEIPDAIGFPGAALRVSGRLPPVWMPGSEQGRVALGVGDLDVALELELASGALPGVSGAVQVDAFVSVVLEGDVRYDAVAGQLRVEHEAGDARVYVQVTRVGTGAGADAGPIAGEARRAAVQEYAETMIAEIAVELVDGALVSVPLPPVRVGLTEPSGGQVDSVVVRVEDVSRAPDHVVLDASLGAELPPEPDAYLALNGDWDEADLATLDIPERLFPMLEHWPGPDPQYRSITVADYEGVTRPRCERYGLNPDGEAICRTRWQAPLAYGVYCGGGRPVSTGEDDDGDGEDESYWGERPLDPVDYCCKLHDLNHFDTATDLNSYSPTNACGFVMCLAQASGYPADIAGRLHDVERARQQMYRWAGALCPGRQPTPLPPPAVAP